MPIPQWLEQLILDLEAAINNLLGELGPAKESAQMRGCPDDNDPCCLSLQAAHHAVEAAQASCKAYAALLDNPCPPTPPEPPPPTPQPPAPTPPAQAKPSAPQAAKPPVPQKEKAPLPGRPPNDQQQQRMK